MPLYNSSFERDAPKAARPSIQTLRLYKKPLAKNRSHNEQKSTS